MNSERVNLYVGCGHHRMKGFTHVEINIAKQFKKGGDVGPPEIMADITKKIPLADKSVDIIYSNETLEHLTYQELINHFLECHRLIKIGGYVRMVVPDMDIMIKNYISKDENLEIAKKESEISPFLPVENHTDLFISRVLYHDHYYLHNYDTLSRALKKTGFSKIKQVGPGETSYKEVSEELFKAEKDTLKFNLIIEAERHHENPIVTRYFSKKPKYFFLKILAETFNIKITKYNNRKPTFPSHLWFLEKFQILKSLIKKISFFN